MRGAPPARRVAIVRCFRESSKPRTRAANSGASASNSAQDATADDMWPVTCADLPRPAANLDATPSWSPDGRFVVFARGPPPPPGENINANIDAGEVVPALRAVAG